MIHRQDLPALFFYYLGYSRVRNLIFRFRREPVTRFVTFHDILPEAFSCFKGNLCFLKLCTNVVSIEDYFSGRLSLDKINVVITFDDGYGSWLTYAVPALKELGLPAIFFVTSGFVGLPEQEEAKFVRSKLALRPGRDRIIRGLAFKDVRRIVEEGFTIGGHTLNHCDLGKVRDSTQVKNEIVDDKKKLEKVTGVKIEYFAYPSGTYYNPEIDLIKALKESGYKSAMTLEVGFNMARSNPYLLHRELTEASMPAAVFKARVFGNSDALSSIKAKLFHKNWNLG